MNITEAPESASPASQDPVTGRYPPLNAPTDGDGRNLARVRLLMRLFGLTISEVAKAGGSSRPYLSRALSGSLKPSPKFYRTLEYNLAGLVAERGSQFFQVPVTTCNGDLDEVLGLNQRVEPPRQ